MNALSKPQSKLSVPIAASRMALATALAMPLLPLGTPLFERQAVAQPATRPAGGPTLAGSEYRGRTVEDVRVIGNTQVSTAVILNVVRTREGDRFDPATVEEDYQRIYGLRKFSNVTARVEPTNTGVIIVFQVVEQRQINSIAVRGNVAVDDLTIRNVIELNVGESIDRFRISLARQSIESLYKSKNFPLASVTVDDELLGTRGELIFNITEGPNVRVRSINFVGNNSFSNWRLSRQIQTRSWVFIFVSGNLDMNTLEEDVGAIRRFYETKGYFDVRVGRKLIFSPDQSNVQVDFVIDEGPRYKIDRITFRGNSAISEADLRSQMRLLEGQNFDRELIDRDVRAMVKAYSPFGFIYQPQSQDPDFIRIEPRTIFRREAGTVELVYDISEGKPFRLGNVVIRGNTRTQDKVIRRELQVQSGELYNSSSLQETVDRLRALPMFERVQLTPIGDDPVARDVLIEVQERRTATLTFGAGVNSNGGVGGNITYEQKNFDITNWPRSFGDLFTDRAFTGAGQTLRATFEPGTQQTNASIRFTEPWIFDQPYSFTGEAYLRNRNREDYVDRRIGGRVTLGKRFDNVWSGSLTLRGEQVDIGEISDREVRAFEILEVEGEQFLTSVGVSVRRDTTNRGLQPWRGTTTTVAWESFGLLGGDHSFQRISADFSWYKQLHEDLVERKTIFMFNLNAGYIIGDAPVFETLYGGGIGSIRGFEFRGVSPRSGPDDDRVGGKFMLTGTAEVSFPLYSDSLRGVVFSDFGTVESDFEIGTFRSSLGFGIRLTIPALGQIPIALDFAIPLTKDSKDDTQIFSFSLGITQ